MENREQNKISEEKAQPFLFPANHRKGSTFFTHSKLSLFLLPLILFSFICSLFSTTADAATIGRPSNYLTLNQGLVGWWTFDGPDMLTNVRDRSGQGNHGNLFGQTSTTTVVGKLGQALKFDGVDDYVETPGISVSTKFSYVFWMKARVLSSGSLVAWSTNRFCGRDGTNIRCTVDGDGSGSAGAASVFDGLWHQIVFVNDENSQTIYKDGVYVGSATETLNTQGGTVRLGNRLASSSYYVGLLDNVRIYNRTLSAQEIKALYNSGAAKLGASPRPSVSDNLSEGLVGHWTFDGSDMIPNVRDRSGNGNHGYLIGQTSTTTVRGKLGQALSFDGSNDYIRLQHSDSLNITGNLTYTAWIKTSSTGIDVIYAGYDASTGNTGTGIAINVTANKFSFWNSAYASWVSSLGNVNNNEWKHVAVVLNGTSAHFYINGQFDVTRSSATPVSYTDQRAIGSNEAAADFFFGGLIDDVRIYNRALSADEVKQLYNETAGAKQAATPTGVAAPSGCTSGLTCGLVGHWTFDGPDMISNVADRSGNGNTGYLLGQTSTTTVRGKLGQALNFDGVDDYVITANNINGGSLTAVTYSFWFKSEMSVTGYVVKWSTSNWCAVLSTNSFKLNCTVDGIAGGSTETLSAVNDGSWHHGVYVISGNNQSLYLDGAFQTSATETFSAPTQKIGIGSNGGISSFFDGSLDDVRIYNRALSADEVKQLYNMGR